jgi:hypothetical protein
VFVGIHVSGRTLPTLLNCRLYIEQRPIIFNFCTTTFFGEILELCYLETLKKTRLKLFYYQVQYRHSLRIVGDSLKEHNSPTFFYLSVIVQFSISLMLIHLLSVMLSVRSMYVWYWRELHMSFKTCVQSHCIYLTIKYV